MNIPVLKTPYSKINNLLYISYLPKVINVAIDIQLFEILSEKGLRLDEITEKLDTKKGVTEALLNVLETIELVTHENGVYSLTHLAEEYLTQKSGAAQLHEVKQFNGSPGPFDFLAQGLKGEVPPFDGKMWESKEAALAMEQGTKSGSVQRVVSFVKGLAEFSSCTKMCDFAGNIGYYSYALLQENQNLCSHVYDLPGVCQIAQELKKGEESFERVTYHDFDIAKGDSFGEGYDLFFSSHFLYEISVNGSFVEFLKKVNLSMKPGGIFISNHMCDKPIDKENAVTLSLVELRTRLMGYPTHQLPEETLKKALSEAGFGDFQVQQPNSSYAFPTLLLAAKKIK